MYKPVYMGRVEVKLALFIIFFCAASRARKPALIKKAVDGMKEVAEKTGLEKFLRGPNFLTGKF